ncbi:helix-turn-helix domain-containing protein [Phormidesmis sp. 146-12]
MKRGGSVEYLESSGQAEQLREIGSKLSQERQARSISLEEIAAKTYIPMRLLGAIDTGRLDLLPEPVFIQGFIRRYADAVGLDGTVLSKGFSIEQPQAPPKPNLMEAPQHPPEEVYQPPVSNQPNWLYVVGGVVGLGVLGLIATSLANRPKVAEPSKPISTQKPVVSAASSPAKKTSPKASPSVVAASSVKVSPSPSVAPSPSLSPAVATGPVEVKVNLIDESWVEVQVDGKLAYEGTLPKGTQKSWSGKQQVVISSGNAGAVSASFNNTTAKPLGALGAVTSVSFPPVASAGN